jgi:hypothetical protein
MRPLKFSSLIALAALSVAACEHPSSIPTGYTYHGDVYKSATPPASKKFTPAQRATMGPEQADQFRLSVYQLAESLTVRAGLPPKPVFVAHPDPMNAFYAQMDNDVRESLRHLGYNLADSPAGAYVMTYSAQLLGDPKAPAPVTSGAPNVRLGLQVFDGMGEGSTMLTEEAGEFYIRGAETLSIATPMFSGIDLPEPTSTLGNNSQE